MLTHPVQRSQLPNGIVLLTVENPAADIVAGRLFFPAGSRWEDRSRAGLAQLVSSLITKGTDRLSALEIADRVESIGAGIGADATTDYLQLSFKSVTSDAPEVFSLAGEILRQPSFPPEQIELERKLTLQAIRSQLEQPFNQAYQRLRQMMYDEHPYAQSPIGIESTVSQISRQDLLDYHQQHIRPDQLVISLAGRITHESALDLVERVFGDWVAPDVESATISHPTVTIAPQWQIQHQATQQAIVMLGYLAPPISDPDYVGINLLNNYLGNGMSSRLFIELREKRGLAYEVSAFYPSKLDTSHFGVYMGTAPENTKIAVSGLRAEVERLCLDLLSATELQTAKDKLLGQHALSHQTNGQLAQTYGWYELMGLGSDFDLQFNTAIENLTANRLQELAQKYLTDPYISIVAPRE
jgi:predicted Zn-dependent peptidase